MHAAGRIDSRGFSPVVLDEVTDDEAQQYLIEKGLPKAQAAGCVEFVGGNFLLLERLVALLRMGLQLEGVHGVP